MNASAVKGDLFTGEVKKHSAGFGEFFFVGVHVGVTFGGKKADAPEGP
jgi:hypothetical protein